MKFYNKMAYYILAIIRAEMERPEKKYISNLYDSGVNPDTIRRLAGHENIE